MFKKFLLGIMSIAVVATILALALSMGRQDDAPEVAEEPVVLQGGQFSSASPSSKPSPTAEKESSTPSASPSPSKVEEPASEPAPPAPAQPAPAASSQQIPVEQAPEVVYQTPVEQPYYPTDDDDDFEYDDDAHEVDDD